MRHPGDALRSDEFEGQYSQLDAEFQAFFSEKKEMSDR